MHFSALEHMYYEHVNIQYSRRMMIEIPNRPTTTGSASILDVTTEFKCDTVRLYIFMFFQLALSSLTPHPLMWRMNRGFVEVYRSLSRNGLDVLHFGSRVVQDPALVIVFGEIVVYHDLASRFDFIALERRPSRQTRKMKEA